jgi:hypothetical protein
MGWKGVLFRLGNSAYNFPLPRHNRLASRTNPLPPLPLQDFLSKNNPEIPLPFSLPVANRTF